MNMWRVIVSLVLTLTVNCCFHMLTIFSFEDAVAAVKQLKLEDIETLKSELGFVEKREVFGPDGKPVDLSSIQQEVVVDPKGHFCCQQEHIQKKHWNTKEQVKVIHEYRHVTHQQKTGYTKCGGLGWGRCSLYKEAYSQKLFTYTQIVEVEDVKFCPDEHVVCCHGYTETADGNCLRLDDLKEKPDLLDSLCRLTRLGLIKSHNKPTNCPSDA